LARRIVRDAIEEAGGTASARRVDAVVQAARSDKSSVHLDLRGLTVEMTAAEVALVQRGARREDAGPSFKHAVTVPGRAGIDETGTVLEASFSHEAVDPQAFRSAGFEAALQADKVTLPLVVRSRRPGDRMRPLGAPGTRRVQDLLVDRKVPVGDRARVPVVEDGRGRIVWVAGVAVAEGVRVTRPEAGVVILKIKKDLA
jgi:tRNA(Ile)-lysidine synthase